MPTPPPESSTLAPQAETRFVRAANGVVLFIARHWLALFNTAWATYVLLPFAAAVLMQVGAVAPARIIYTLYSYTCHQIPDHSYFLFGPSLSPQGPELIAAGMPDTENLFVQRTFVGNASIGYKVALCQRDVAIYAAVLAAGLLFALLRRRIRALPVKWLLLLALPMAIDGGTQLVGLRASNWWLRTFTGALFGLAAVWWAYPYIDEAMQDVVEGERVRKAAAASPGASSPALPPSVAPPAGVLPPDRS